MGMFRFLTHTHVLWFGPIMTKFDFTQPIKKGSRAGFHIKPGGPPFCSNPFPGASCQPGALCRPLGVSFCSCTPLASVFLSWSSHSPARRGFPEKKKKKKEAIFTHETQKTEGFPENPPKKAEAIDSPLRVYHGSGRSGAANSWPGPGAKSGGSGHTRMSESRELEFISAVGSDL